MGRDKVLKRCSRTRHPSSSPVKGGWTRMGVGSSSAVVSCHEGNGGRTPPNFYNPSLREIIITF